MHYVIVQVEGFELHKLLTLCLKEGISVWDVRVSGDLIMIFKLDAADWKHFLRLAGNRYRITIIREKGWKSFFIRLLANKFALIGMILFVILIYFQSSFISEIRIYGYEGLTEREIRAELMKAGLYEGCSKSLDLERVKIHMYRNLEDISWIGIELKGNLAEVTLVEGKGTLEQEDQQNGTNHIIAAKEGYIEKIIAKEGMEIVSKGDFVKKGDLLISGKIPIVDKTYTQDPENPSYRYVEADGEVFAKTIHRYVFYQEKEILHKRKTGKNFPGISLTIGNRTVNTADFLWPYDAAIYQEKTLIDALRPVPIKISINRQWEIELWKKKKDQEAIEKEANRQAREAIRNNLQDSYQIINKSLKFYEEENIIEVIILIEAYEEIGEKQYFKPAMDMESQHPPEEGM